MCEHGSLFYVFGKRLLNRVKEFHQFGHGFSSVADFVFDIHA